MVELTKDAQAEIQSLEREARIANETSDKMFSQGYKSEGAKYRRKWAKLYDRKTDIESSGVSSAEKRAIIAAIPSMTHIHGDRNIGSNTVEVAGYVKKLNSYVVVKYTKFSSFMKNVRGCASLAGTVDLEEVRFISKQVYDSIVKGVEESGGYKQTTSFMGASQTTISGKAVEKPKLYINPAAFNNNDADNMDIDT